MSTEKTLRAKITQLLNEHNQHLDKEALVTKLVELIEDECDKSFTNGIRAGQESAG